VKAFWVQKLFRTFEKWAPVKYGSVTAAMLGLGWRNKKQNNRKMT